MVSVLIFIGVIVISLVAAYLVGSFSVKYFLKFQNKKLLEGAQEVMDGKRKNEIEIEGIMVEAKQFIVRDDEDNERKIDLMGNPIRGAIKNG